MLKLKDEVLTSLCLNSAILLIKVLSMALLTAKWRLKKRIFISPEDATKKGKVCYNDPDIERIRRSHLNDLENIPVFILSGFVYTLTNPDPQMAINLFRIYTISRLAHTYVYVNNVRQPARAWAFRISFAINLYILLQTVAYFLF